MQLGALRCFAALASTAPKRSASPALVPPSGGTLQRSGTQISFDRNSSVLVHLHSFVVTVIVSSSLLLCLVLLVLQLPFSSASTLVGGNTLLACKIHTQTQQQTKQKTVKCLSTVSDRDADHRSRLPATRGAVKCLSPEAIETPTDRKSVV